MNGLLAGLAILMIGDSHMVTNGYLITTLHNDLTEQGATVNSYGMCGANAGDWVYKTTVSCGKAERHGTRPARIDREPRAPGWTFDELAAANHPNLVIVEMGDTMAGYGQQNFPRAWIYDQVRTLTQQIAKDHVQCVWVGPPWGAEGTSYHKTFSRVKEMSEFLAKSVAPCQFIDSTRFSTPGQWPTIDGQHLTATGYREWGKDIAGALDQLVSQGEIKR
ncbi:MAG: SGNH/GDSL hydrolase family protein [Stellaceae bacterium]